MKCIFCGDESIKVLDSRDADDNSIRRRRECEKCGRRFTTYEKVEQIPLYVIKRNETREEFDRDKLLRGLRHACRKRPVLPEQLESMVEEIENQIRSSGIKEIAVRRIGTLAMNQLKQVDQVAYVRFASVYKDFRDVESFIKELNALKK